MKHMNKIGGVFWCLFAVFLSLHLLGHDALAAEKSSNWRPIYDLILRYINFGIIVFVIVKYGKTPIMNFLRGQKDKLASEIKRLEDEKEELAVKIKETLTTIDESEIRFAEIKDRIVQQGERKKAEIIESAQNQSRLMIEDAKRRINTYFLQAKNEFKAELIDRAMDMAMERLPKEITPEDNDNFNRLFMESAFTE
ncbi:MAG: ATP synthase F0 subunit B [Deltaproteobacteria bacterium]|jgi:F-type H+-transporting ATPase subunit b|nr:ATP synthase F0 subunit B [Deltaproteobacteria bacterium]MBW2492630.1 ATP synthase F0 subunit B [Deltaproteobacteria bacterium]